ncbi:AarF/ABC1/UbiB kinase family protein [Conexibacter sp. DBS9H8]|uniref:ABC1 kinase family protein n=1 Tax=Conexibacter sp. DBS9H8 TaxID=2937801 RepID=UPI0020109C34|nr:AarF/ABC1/UbiB kinase family protein [Conexibacter sp. DBS9H8]
MSDADKIPTSRLIRTARLGRLAAGQAVRSAGTKTANLARDDEGRRAAAERRNIQAAEQIVAALGTMKGAAMKVGQVLSVLDAGIVPPEYQAEFQAKLAELRDSAPKVSFAAMAKVIESDLGEPISRVFADFNPEPIAAASIGQVYEATLAADGRRVAVKVQYPGVAAAVRADMKNLGMILRLAKRIAPGMDAQAMGREIQERIFEELDYELEATNQRTLARLHRGHPFFVIPDVIGDLCRERVLVSEFVEGTGFEALKERSQAERNRIGEMIFRFYFGCLFRHHQFSGDPHPGNSLLLDDGRMAFFDFGLFKSMPAAAVEAEIAVHRAIIEGDAERVLALGTEVGIFSDPSRFDPERVLAQLRDASHWYTVDAGEIEITRELTTRVVIDVSDPRSEYFSQMRHENAPPDHIFAARMEVMCLAVLSQLRARGNFHRIAREWFYSDPPATELGALEAAFYGR